ncbi:MAG: VWA domain-containing protein, partial [Bdellovibrionota bacterium]
MKTRILPLLAALVFAQLIGCASNKTASYHYAQKQIERGDLDFENRLRVDEYVNAFPQNEFAKPAAGKDVELRVDFFTDVLPPTKTKAIAQVAIRTREAIPSEKSKKMGFVFVLDVSGSMSEDNKFLDAIEATLAMISELADGTEFSLVTFSSDAKVAIPPTIVSKESREVLKAKVKSLEVSGGTNIEAGLVLGYKTLTQLTKGTTSRLLLLTDGISNVGITDPKKLAQKAGVQYLEGARISTIGLGHDVDETTLRTIATDGQGAYYFAENARSLKTLFMKELDSLMIPISIKVFVQIGSQNAKITQVYG